MITYLLCVAGVVAVLGSVIMLLVRGRAARRSKVVAADNEAEGFLLAAVNDSVKHVNILIRDPGKKNMSLQERQQIAVEVATRKAERINLDTSLIALIPHLIEEKLK